MRKVCFILPYLGGGGAEKIALYLLNNLDKNKFKLVLILTNEGGEYLKDLNKNIEIIELKKKRARYAIFKLYSVLREIQPDIAFIFSADIALITGLFIAPLLKKIKFIVREINIQSFLIKNKLRYKLLCLSYKNINHIISQSKDMTYDLVNYTNISPSKITEINNPIDMKYINEKLKIDTNIILPYKKENYNLLCVGRLTFQKGYDLIINIMVLLKDKNIKLYILGNGPDEEKLKEQIKVNKLENVVFLLGKVSNPYIYIKQADLFILSSRFEGFPNVLLEAGVCGIYSICNDSYGGINEIIQNNINGNIVNFNNKEMVANLIYEKVLENHNSEKIKKSILSRYALKIILKKYEKLLEKENSKEFN